MTAPITELTATYTEVFGLLAPEREVPTITISFYPYIGVNHTIRLRNGEIYVRLAELCRDMPAREHRALAFILIAKLLRKKVPPTARRIYSDYAGSVTLREKALANKQQRGRKRISGATGKYFDLDEIFESVNRQYFHGTVKKPTLTWSARRTYRILGHHDAAHDTIVISRSLDDATTPEFVVSYIMYHELLHIVHPTQYDGNRRRMHTPEFRRDERKFRFFDAAERWIEENIRSIRKRARAANRRS